MNFIYQCFDRDLRSAILNKFINSSIVPLSSFIIVFCLTPEKQGIYYVFISLLGLKGFFELGINAVIGQLTPHYKNKDGELDENFHKYANNIIKKTTLIFVTFVLPIGFFYLRSNEETNNFFVLFCWIVTILIVACKNFTDLKISLLGGVGSIVEANKCSRESSILYAISLWILLFLGMDLLAFPLATLVSVIYQHIIFQKKFKIRTNGEYNNLDQTKISQKVKKLIWRAGFTYISGYFVFQIQQPMIMSFLAAETCAKYGFCTSLATILVGFSTFSISTKFPRYTSKIAGNNIQGAKNDFKKYIKLSSILLILSVVLTLLAFYLLHYIPKFQARLVDNGVMLVLLLQSSIQIFSMSFTYWPRAFQQEPFSKVAMTQMILTPVLTYIGLNYYGLLGLVIGNLISWMIAFCVIINIFSKFWDIMNYNNQKNEY